MIVTHTLVLQSLMIFFTLIQLNLLSTLCQILTFVTTKHIFINTLYFIIYNLLLYICIND